MMEFVDQLPPPVRSNPPADKAAGDLLAHPKQWGKLPEKVGFAGIISALARRGCVHAECETRNGVRWARVSCAGHGKDAWPDEEPTQPPVDA